MKSRVLRSPETTTGGMALKFYSTIRIDIRKKESLKKGDNVYGNSSRSGRQK
jgi:recombination protein RecA